mmetsp:Transcript_3677/g.12351  ORF Transcript_3677/g.12351 Transcript_3677/m.12351 type:complete len:318 (-) Transcript_3677:618-1571(-)
MPTSPGRFTQTRSSLRLGSATRRASACACTCETWSPPSLETRAPPFPTSPSLCDAFLGRPTPLARRELSRPLRRRWPRRRSRAAGFRARRPPGARTRSVGGTRCGSLGRWPTRHGRPSCSAPPLHATARPLLRRRRFAPSSSPARARTPRTGSSSTTSKTSRPATPSRAPSPFGARSTRASMRSTSRQRRARAPCCTRRAPRRTRPPLPRGSTAPSGATTTRSTSSAPPPRETRRASRWSARPRWSTSGPGWLSAASPSPSGTSPRGRSTSSCSARRGTAQSGSSRRPSTTPRRPSSCCTTTRASAAGAAAGPSRSS